MPVRVPMLVFFLTMFVWAVELGVWAGVELLLLACAWLWVRHVPESAAQVYTAIKEPEHLVVCDDGGAGIELESRQE